MSALEKVDPWEVILVSAASVLLPENVENRKDLPLKSNLRLKGKSHQYLTFFCVRTVKRGLSARLFWMVKGEMSA